MVAANLGRELENMGYRRVTLNIQQCQLYYAEEPAAIYTVALFLCPQGTEFTRDQYEHILKQIRTNFSGNSGKKVLTQGVICTDRVQAAREIYSPGEGGWIVDQEQGRLLVYDWHDSYYDPVRTMIEWVLGGDRGYETSYAGRETGKKPAGAYGRTNRNRPKLFAFSPVNAVLVALNVIVYLAVSLTGSVYDTEHMMEWGAMYWPAVFIQGEYYRVITYMFLHFGFSHLFNNMLVLAFLGDNLERALGKIKYLILYLGTGIAAGFASMGWNCLQQREVVGVGASGAIFGVVGALVYVVAVNRGRLEDLSIRRLIFFVLLSLYSGLTSQGVDNTAHIAGFISGFLMAVILYRRRSDSGGKRNPANPGYQI